MSGYFETVASYVEKVKFFPRGLNSAYIIFCNENFLRGCSEISLQYCECSDVSNLWLKKGTLNCLSKIAPRTGKPFSYSLNHDVKVTPFSAS